jgi:hypothetical protein
MSTRVRLAGGQTVCTGDTHVPRVLVVVNDLLVVSSLGDGDDGCSRGRRTGSESEGSSSDHGSRCRSDVSDGGPEHGD